MIFKINFAWKSIFKDNRFWRRSFGFLYGIQRIRYLSQVILKILKIIFKKIKTLLRLKTIKS
jgi:hypothetical protein